MSLSDPVDLPDAADWYAAAACRGRNPDEFHPVNPRRQVGPEHRAYVAKVEAAKRVCDRCPTDVKARCLALALSLPAEQDRGIYGGHTEQERRRMPRTVAQRWCTECRGEFTPTQTRQLYCGPVCREVANNRRRHAALAARVAT